MSAEAHPGNLQAPGAATLAERLGHPAGTRLLIVSCDDLGMCRAANQACCRALRDGVATAASLMTPCPLARQAADDCRGEDIGVHLTLNAEFRDHRWGPLTAAPSLRTGDGSFPRSVDLLLAQCDTGEVAAELRAQIELALAWGVDVSHLDAHMYAVQDHAEFFDIYLELALEFVLPIRLSGSVTDPGGDFRRRAGAAGVVAPDHLVPLSQVGSREPLERALTDLPAGVTEFHAHPALDGAEIRRIATSWAGRVDDHVLYTLDDDFRRSISESGAVLIGYRELRDVMRARPKTGST